MDRERIGKYRIVGELGRGTMGEVYKALDPVLNRYVALKTLTGRVGPGDEALARFQREAQAAALLNHPNIVTVYDFGEEGGLLYMAMELLEGTDLRDAIDSDSLRGQDDRLDIMDGVLAALDYAHGKGVVHRDVKPANIHIGGDRQVKIMDFGLARIGSSEMTQDGIVLGTPNYMSPEQALGDPVDGRSDLFSAGAVLYELLTGHKPFEADSTPSVLFQVVHKTAPPVKRWAPQTAAPLIAVVEKALEKDRKKRFASAADMRAALASARLAVVSVPALGAATKNERLPGRPDPTPPPQRSLRSATPRRGGADSMRGSRPSRSARRRGAFGLVVAGGGILVLLGTIGGWLWLNRPPQQPSPATNAQVGVLTHALAATQAQLAARELEDKNYAAAVARAETALRLGGSQPQAQRILSEARERMKALELAVQSARSLTEQGEMEAASQELSRVLELDPRHPAAQELSTRLNSAFQKRAEDAAQAARAARELALRAGAASGPAFADAVERARTAESLAERLEYAEATRSFLEARDAYDRARRLAGSGGSARPAATPAPLAGAPTPAPRLATASLAPPAGGATAAQLPAPAHRFRAEATKIETHTAGRPRGFDTRDVSSQRTPDFTGRIRFEVEPEAVRPGDSFVVRIFVANEGRRAQRVRALSLATVIDGQRTPAETRILTRELEPQRATLVAEYAGLWRDAVSWAFEVVVTSDRDETISARVVSF